MIELIYGVKGSGKTKSIIDKANEKSKVAKGNVVFISDKAKYSMDISNNVRFVVTSDYAVSGIAQTVAFIKGLLAANADICNIYIDGASRILTVEADGMESFMTALEGISTAHKVDFTLTISAAEVPKFMKRYL